jgi:hypothetical protein
MSIARRSLPVAVLAAGLLVSATGCASNPYYRYPGRGSRQVDDRAYMQGYEDGRRHGENDARRRRSFDYARHDDYRDADDGFRGYGDRNAYRSMYRDAFVTGYGDGYRRYAGAGGYGGYGGSPYPGRSGARYPSYPGYPNGSGRPGAYATPAADNGFRDGYEAGRDDARDRDAYDPVRSSRYRSGDRGYESRYGSRDAYKRDYRAAFQSGYDRGYRENRR